MASSMAYIHVAIPLNISTFASQIDIFETYLNKLTSLTTSSDKQVTFTKAIRDLASFAATRLHHLRTSLRFVDTILPEDTSATLPARSKRFLPLIFPSLMGAIHESLKLQRAQSLENDFFFPNGSIKNASHVPQDLLLHSRQKRF
jgi:hypothetical protein